MLEPKDIITGEKFQDLANVSISKLEHKQFESQKLNTIDIDNFNFPDYSNPELVYVNSSLISLTKPNLLSSNLFEKLNLFNNKFTLILHNSDQDFNYANLGILQAVPKIQKIYTQNLNTTHRKVNPLPIGLANSMWKHGDLETFCGVVNNEVEKTKQIYYNFTVEGGMRPEYRVSCKDAADKLNLPINPSLNYKEYLQDLQKHKFCLCPSGNGLDTHRLWECLYLKVIPILIDSNYSAHFQKTFPLYLLKKWSDLDLSKLSQVYENADWSNYDLLKFNTYVTKFLN